MCSLSKERSLLSRETNQNVFFSELCPFFDIDFLSCIKHPSAERWHPHAVLLLYVEPRSGKRRLNASRRCIMLILYHTIPTFNDPEKRLWKKEKMLATSIFSFSHNVFNSIKDKNCHFSKFILSSANALNLV